MASRPFGVQCIIVGADVNVNQRNRKQHAQLTNGQPRVMHSELIRRARLFMTDPAGAVEESTCVAIGRESEAIMAAAAVHFNTDAELSPRWGVDIIKPLLRKLQQQDSSSTNEEEPTDVDAFEMVWQEDGQQVDFVLADDESQDHPQQ